ncbi:MAG TPA: DUF202 domain-containing protein [Polyangia bacterium]|nr:DUF202 domain-containing protein [Polyangia bacterium]
MVDDPRLLQANERTLLAWLRTGVSLITFGFFIAKLGLWLRLETSLAPGVAKAVAATGTTHSAAVGGLLVLLGAVTETLGVIRYVRVRRALLAQRPVPVGAADVIILAVVVGAIGFYMAIRLVLLTKAPAA